MPKTKLCKGCGEDLPLSMFHKKKDTKDGLRTKCKGCRNAEKSAWKSKNPEKVRAQNKRDNDRRDPEKRREYYRNNRERILEQNRATYNVETQRAWQEADRGKVRSYCANRRAKIIEQTPDDANQELIQAVYDAARIAEIYTGREVHVDHIIPLSLGGLHHEDNLQLLYKEDNLSKGARL